MFLPVDFRAVIKKEGRCSQNTLKGRVTTEDLNADPLYPAFSHYLSISLRSSTSRNIFVYGYCPKHWMKQEFSCEVHDIHIVALWSDRAKLHPVNPKQTRTKPSSKRCATLSPP